MDYYNTNRETGSVLTASRHRARSQQDVILEFFIDNPLARLTPFQVQKGCLELQLSPITSIRRAITNLTKEGKLIKTKVTRIGRYGKANYTWQLNTTGNK